MVSEERPKQTPENPKDSLPKQSNAVEGQTIDGMFSPRFRSVAAMAGWDEETLLIASLVVEDTPDREQKHKKRHDLNFKTPPTTSRRKRRAQRKSPVLMPVAVLDLEDDENIRKDPKGNENKKTEPKVHQNEEEKKTREASISKGSGGSNCSSSAIPCMDKLREELSCAICLEICFEPSTTPCGHSFCKKCLRSAADKCGKKCPKCRQLISNGRSCTVNTVLWNTIQLLFPQEVESRKSAAALKVVEEQPTNLHRATHHNARNRIVQALESPETERQGPERRDHQRRRNQSVRLAGISSRREDGSSGRRRREREVPIQDEDAALALRLQREEFMEVVRGNDGQHRSSLTLARANLRAMASRAMNIRVRGRTT